MTADEIKALVERLKPLAEAISRRYDWVTPEWAYGRFGSEMEAEFVSACSPDAILALLSQVETLTLENQRLRVDAQRWQELAKLGNPTGDVIQRETRVVPPTMPRLDPYGPAENVTYTTYQWVLREVRFRWWAKEDEKSTLHAAIDAARAQIDKEKP